MISVAVRFISCNDNSMVKQACEYVLGHLGEELSVKELSKRLYISKSYLSDLFKQ